MPVYFCGRRCCGPVGVHVPAQNLAPAPHALPFPGGAGPCRRTTQGSDPSHLLLAPSYGHLDSLSPVRTQVYWPDSLCHTHVLRRLMGDLDLVENNIQNPELFWMLQQWKKIPYRYSGRNAKGIDCSGLVCEIQRSIYGRPYSGGSADLYPRLNKVRKSDLKEGDMVFFKIRKRRISHVGLYLGNNKFLHATTHAGVIVSDLNEPYYLKRYYGAGRDASPPGFQPVYLPNTSYVP